MSVAAISLREDYWDTFEIQSEDVEFLYGHLLEAETPMTPEELILALVKDRLIREKKAIERRRSEGGDIYLPQNEYQVGQTLVIPALNWRAGKVLAVRPGVNPDLDDFSVIQVEFENEELREFAANLVSHPLNDPPEIAEDDVLLNPEAVIDEHGVQLTAQLIEELHTNPDFVYIAGRWFPQALVVDVNVGHLNLAEAVLDMEGGGPLPTVALMEQVELPTDVNPKLVEFSLDLALQEDQRFDEVGPAGQVLWYLRRQEPPEVLQTPEFLRYTEVDYDASILSGDMLKWEADLEDELSPGEYEGPDKNEATVRLIYPHWRAGTLPLSSRMQKLFPTAYEAPRIRINLVGSETGDAIAGWIVRSEKYVFGLKDWYEKRGVMPGSRVKISRGSEPGKFILHADTHRSTKEWVRTVIVGADGGIVLAMLKQVVSTDFDDRMAIAVPNPEALDNAWELIRKERTPFERVVVDIFKELAKLTPQSHVHATELYAGVNLLRRCPPGPILALLESRPWFAHLGDFYYRLTDFEG